MGDAHDPAVGPDEVAPLQEVFLRLTRRLRLHSQTDLTLSQMSALSSLERNGPTRVGVLARREQISKSSISRLIANLERMGYLVRTVDPDDGRSFLVTISPHGFQLLGEAREHANDFLAAEVARLQPADQAAVLGSLASLERLVALPQSAAKRRAAGESAPEIA